MTEFEDFLGLRFQTRLVYKFKEMHDFNRGFIGGNKNDDLLHEISG